MDVSSPAPPKAPCSRRSDPGALPWMPPCLCSRDSGPSPLRADAHAPPVSNASSRCPSPCPFATTCTSPCVGAFLGVTVMRTPGASPFSSCTRRFRGVVGNNPHVSHRVHHRLHRGDRVHRVPRAIGLRRARAVIHHVDPHRAGLPVGRHGPLQPVPGLAAPGLHRTSSHGPMPSLRPVGRELASRQRQDRHEGRHGAPPAGASDRSLAAMLAMAMRMASSVLMAGGLILPARRSVTMGTR